MNASKEMELYFSSGKVPVLAIGETAVRAAQEMDAEFVGRLDVYVVRENDKESLPVIFVGMHPLRLLLYSSNGISLKEVPKFAAAAKIGGTVIAVEIVEHPAASHTSGQIGVDMMIRTECLAECVQVTRSLLQLLAFSQDPMCPDVDDAMALFGGADYAKVSTGAAAGKQALSKAIAIAMQGTRWKTSSLRGVLLDIACKDESLMEEISDAVEKLSAHTGEDCNMMFFAHANPEMVDDVKATLIVTRGSGQKSKGNASWLLEEWEDP